MCDLHLSILKYIGVHGFVDLLNHKCDLGRFPLDSGLGPPGKILLFLPPYPLKISASGISSDPPRGGGGTDIFWNHPFAQNL